MKDAEKAIGTVMAGLGGAADAGLEGRVADGLRRRMAETEAGGRGRPFVFARRRLTVGLGAAAVAVAGMLLTVRMGAPRVGGGAVRHDGDAAGVTAAGVERVTEDRVGGWNTRAPRRLRAGRRGVMEAEPAMRVVSTASRKGEKVVSFPAPPMPLTREERLLLRVARHGGPEEVAMLEVSPQAARDLDETTGFQEFFGRPESVEETMKRVHQGESR